MATPPSAALPDSASARRSLSSAPTGWAAPRIAAAILSIVGGILGAVLLQVGYRGIVFGARLDERPYESIAAAVGIDRARFRTVLAGKAPAARVAEDIAVAHRLGIEGAPAIFVDGRYLWNWHLLTHEARPVINLRETEKLWDRLLGKPQ